MRRMARAQVVVWMLGLWFPMLACAGWVIEQVEYANPGAEGAKTIQFISKNRPPEGYQRIDLHTFLQEELEKMKRGE